MAQGHAGAASLATTGTVSLINNRGNLGDTFDDTLSSDSLKGALIAAASAGIAHNAYAFWGGTTDIASDTTRNLDLGSLEGIGRFAGNRATQAIANAGLESAINGGSLRDNLDATLLDAVAHVASGVLFNAVGDLAIEQGWPAGGPQKIALHALVGGLVAETTGGDFRDGAIAAGANEALVDHLATVVNGDPTLLVLASQITGIVAAELTGSDVNQGAQIAGQATTYNRLLHASEERWLKENAKRFAKEQGISEQEALERLSQQALKDVDYLWRSLLSDGNDSAAQAFLASTGQTFTNDLGEQQALFTAKGQQLFRPEMFADTADSTFYRDFVRSGISRDLSAGIIEEVKGSGVALRNDAVDLVRLLVERPGAVLEGLWEGIKGLPQGIVDGFHESGNAIGEGAAVALNEGISDRLDAIYGLDVSAAQRGLLLVRTLGAIAGAGTAGAVGKTGTELAGNITEVVSKQLDRVLNGLAEQALLKSGGVHGPDGEPLLDLKQLTNAQKGAMGELFGPHTVKQIVPDGKKLARMPKVGETGIDDLYKVNRPDVDYVVIEYKFVGPNSKTGASGLGKTQDGRQGSESWVLGSGRLQKAVGDENSILIENSIKAGRYETWVVATRPDGSTEVQVLDALGKAKMVNTSRIFDSGVSEVQP